MYLQISWAEIVDSKLKGKDWTPFKNIQITHLKLLDENKKYVKFIWMTDEHIEILKKQIFDNN